MTQPDPSEQLHSPTLHIPHSIDIVREAVHLYCRSFWTYFSIMLVGAAALLLVLSLLCGVFPTVIDLPFGVALALLFGGVTAATPHGGSAGRYRRRLANRAGRVPECAAQAARIHADVDCCVMRSWLLPHPGCPRRRAVSRFLHGRSRLRSGRMWPVRFAPAQLASRVDSARQGPHHVADRGGVHRVGAPVRRIQRRPRQRNDRPHATYGRAARAFRPTSREFFCRQVRSFSPPPSRSPPSSSPKCILYRRAVLLYPPTSPAESPVGAAARKRLISVYLWRHVFPPLAPRTNAPLTPPLSLAPTHFRGGPRSPESASRPLPEGYNTGRSGDSTD